MELIMALMALGVSFAALWMGSTAMRRSDGDMSTFILNARKELSATKTEIDAKVSDMTSRVDTLDKLMSKYQAEAGKSTATLNSLQSEIAALKNDLASLDESIPKQYRHPTPRSGQPRVTQ